MAPGEERAWRRLLVACAIAVTLALVGGVAYARRDDAPARWLKPPGSAAPAPAPKPSGPIGGIGVPPPADAKARTEWAAETAGTVLSMQATSLYDGDEAGYLKYVDAPARAEMLRRFKVLRAMKVGKFTQQTTSAATPEGGQGGGAGNNGAGTRWSITIEIGYCFVSDTCEPATVNEVKTSWVLRDNALLLAAISPSTGAESPRPWEVSNLSVQVGNRVIVAAPPQYAHRLPAAVKAADSAAAVADRFAKWNPAPPRYLVYLAGPAELKTWYGQEAPSWSAGVTRFVSETSAEVVLNVDEAGKGSRGWEGEVAASLRHELTHVATLVGAGTGDDKLWWLVEGIAVYAENTGQPTSNFGGRADVRTYVNSGRWNGAVDSAEPTASAPQNEVNGKYGIAYLAVRRIAERYGEAKMLAFFGAVVRNNVPLETAAVQQLGAPYAAVKADCAAYVRQVAK